MKEIASHCCSGEKRRLEKSETKGLKIGLDNKVKYFGEKGTIKGHKPPLDAISACLNSDLPKQFWGAHSLLSFKIGIARQTGIKTTN